MARQFPARARSHFKKPGGLWITLGGATVDCLAGVFIDWFAVRQLGALHKIEPDYSTLPSPTAENNEHQLTVYNRKQMPTSKSETICRRLQRHLDRMPVGFPATPSGVELRILQRLFTPEEAGIALELSAIPEPAATSNVSVRASRWRNCAANSSAWLPKVPFLAFPVAGEMRYGKMTFAIGMYERQLKTLTPEFERESQQYFDEAFGEAFHTGKTTQLRIVPVNKQIAGARRHHLRPQTHTHRAIARTLRHTALHLPARPRPARSAMHSNQAARQLSHDRAGRAVGGGLRHGASRDARRECPTCSNARTATAWCCSSKIRKRRCSCSCCCGCCCGVLHSAKRLPRPADFFSTNFYAVANDAACETCGVCEMC
jgi:hypothetical protein